MNIVTLPREIQLMILGELKVGDLVRVSETCHQLKDVARDTFLWKNLTLTYEKIRSNNEACRNHVSRCSSLREIFIVGKKKMTRSDEIMAVVMNANDTLTSINLSPSFAELSNSSFERIAWHYVWKVLWSSCHSYVCSCGSLQHTEEIRSG